MPSKSKRLVLVMVPLAPEAFAASVGCDWADAKHDVCSQTTGTARREFLSFARRPEALDAWVQTLRTRCHGYLDKAPGHPARELTWDDIAAKFMDCAAQAQIDLGKAERAFGMLTRLETCADIREVLALLH